MAIKFKIERLQPYRLRLDPDVWLRYRLLTEDEAQAFQEFSARPDDERDEDAARAALRDLLGVVRELWHQGTCYKDADDIADTIMHTPAFLSEVVDALIQGSTVSEEEAPF